MFSNNNAIKLEINIIGILSYSFQKFLNNYEEEKTNEITKLLAFHSDNENTSTKILIYEINSILEGNLETQKAYSRREGSIQRKVIQNREKAEGKVILMKRTRWKGKKSIRINRSKLVLSEN